MNVDIAGVAVIDMRVQHGGDEIMRGADGVNVAGQVEIEILHWHDLAVTAAGRPAFDAEGGALRGLAHGDDRVFADMRHRLADADGGGGFAFAQRRRGDGGDIDVFCLRS